MHERNTVTISKERERKREVKRERKRDKNIKLIGIHDKNHDGIIQMNNNR